MFELSGNSGQLNLVPSSMRVPWLIRSSDMRNVEPIRVIKGIQPYNAIKLQAQKKRLIIKSIAFNNALLTRKTTLYKYYLICQRGSTYKLYLYVAQCCIKRLYRSFCNAHLLRYQYPHLTDSQLENISP